MATEHWERVQLLFEAVLAQPDHARTAFIEQACGDEKELRDELLSMLHTQGVAGEDQTMPHNWLGVLAGPEPLLFAAGDLVAGRYQIRQLLGRGGMGEVYEAWDGQLSIPVALKTLNLTAGTDRAQHLKREGLLARSISHPNVCRVYDLGRHGQGNTTVWFLTMELLSGQTLAKQLREVGKLSLDRALRLAIQMAAGLGAAHRAGVVHRDFKSDNVMLVGKGGDEQAVVTDFGIARAASLTPTDEDGSDMVMGTPGYMAPEQLQGAEVGPSADIYALGMVLYEMSTGRLPFPVSGIATAQRRISDQVPSPRSIRQDIDERWEAVILRCLEYEPSRRFGRAEDVAGALTGELPVAVADLHGTVMPARHHLPPERDDFIGREAELDELARNLAGHTRLVTLFATGGMGKTRLAVRYGWQHLSQWPGGLWFCDLTEARNVNAIASALAGSLDVQLGAGDPLEQLGNAIAGRGRCLIILDNFERVAPHAAATVGRWLKMASEARFLVTSREKLGLEEIEKVQVVGSMSADMGLALLTVRARWLCPGLDLRGSEAEAAREIVQLVDGMPLAIELAAARMRVMSATQIVQQMRSRFQLLTGGRSARHETLAVTIDGSWELLRPWEQAACAQCTVFEGGFTLESAEAVLDLREWPDAPWLVEVVQSLVDKSFLRTWVPSGTHGGAMLEARLGMYVSIQDYARLKLREGTADVADGIGGERAAKARHSRWFARYGSDDMLASLDRHGGTRQFQALAQELENLKAACRCAIGQGDLGTAAAAYRATWSVLQLRGPFTEGVEIGRQIVDRPGLDRAEKAMTLRTLAQAERHADQAEGARDRFEEAIAIHRLMGDRRREGVVVGNLAGLLQEQGLVNEARTHYEMALTLARETGDRRNEGVTLSNLATLCAVQGRMEEAQAHLLSALAIHRELGNRRHQGVTLTTLTNVHAEQGRWAEAWSYGEAALEIHREVGNRRFECSALW
jgi:predicted ATPase